MKIQELWEEYLDTINSMAELTAEVGMSLYGMDNRREKIHLQLVECYKNRINAFDEEEFKGICATLDKVIGFNPPLKRLEEIKHYAIKMVKFMEDKNLSKMKECSERKRGITMNKTTGKLYDDKPYKELSTPQKVALSEWYKSNHKENIINFEKARRKRNMAYKKR